MQRLFIKFIVLTAMLLGLPLLGVFLAGYPVGRYLEFPPESRYVVHAAFSWTVFFAYALFILVSILVFIFVGTRRHDPGRITGQAEHKVVRTTVRRVFPWWGWLGVLFCAISWIFAWTRFTWFAPFQPHIFTPLWLSLIVVLNALGYRQNGRCLMIDRPLFFLLLFPLSATFWWFFEYLNRFVQNWYYVGKRFGATEYFLYATAPFATVLPAVLSAREWIGGSGWIQTRFRHVSPIGCPRPKLLAGAVLCVSAAGLMAIGVWPNILFSLLWISPLLIVVSLQALFGERHVGSEISEGDWRVLVSSALAALFCGLFWETWNFYSMAKWIYAVPYVHRFQVFEMPVLGYAGYLPFGLECVVVGRLLDNLAPAYQNALSVRAY